MQLPFYSVAEAVNSIGYAYGGALLTKTNASSLEERNYN